MQQLRILKRNKDCKLVYASLLAFIKFIFYPKMKLIFSTFCFVGSVLPINMSNFDHSLQFSIATELIFYICP